MGKIREGKWEVQASSQETSHWDGRFSAENKVGGIVVALQGDRRELRLLLAAMFIASQNCEITTLYSWN